MSKIATLARRELGSFFFSLIGYIALAVYLSFMGFLFSMFVFVSGQTADMRPVFTWSHLALIFVVPLMTMSTFADEYASGRIEMLRTSPITDFDILMGKFLGAMGFYAVILLSTVVFVVLLAIFGRPDWGVILAGYFGLLLVGVLTVSIGLFFSALTRYQIVSALLGFITLIFLGILADLAYMFMANTVSISNVFLRLTRDFLQYIALRPHLENFARGAVETKDIAYFLSGGFLFLVLTYLVLESRKWR